LQLEDLGKPGKFGVIALHGAAASHSQGMSFFYNPSKSQFSSTSVTADAGAHGWVQQTVPTYNLPAIFEERQVRVVHHFKIDCEGCEFEPWFYDGLAGWVTDPAKIRFLAGEIHWHLASPHQGNDPVIHVSPASTEGLFQVLMERGCEGVEDAREKGEAKLRGAVCQQLRCS
jgi:hypothetical protein